MKEPEAMVEELCRMGFTRGDAENALRTHNYDLVLAMDDLLGSSKDSQPKPRGPQYVQLFGEEPQTDEERASWVSPVYVRVGGYLTTFTDDRGENFTGYMVTVIVKDGHRWKLTRRYSDFYNLYRNIASYLTGIQAQFPPKSIFALAHSDLEERREMLDSWMREVCFTPHFICNENVMRELSIFLDLEAQIAIPGGFSKAEATSSPLLRSYLPAQSKQIHESPIVEPPTNKYTTVNPQKGNRTSLPTVPFPFHQPGAPARQQSVRPASVSNRGVSTPLPFSLSSHVAFNPFDDDEPPPQNRKAATANPFDEVDEGDCVEQQKPAATPKTNAPSIQIPRVTNPFDDDDDDASTIPSPPSRDPPKRPPNSPPNSKPVAAPTVRLRGVAHGPNTSSQSGKSLG